MLSLTQTESCGKPSSVVNYMKGDKSIMRPLMTNSEQVIQLGAEQYTKAATALYILRETVMGPELFDMAFKEYAQRWAFKHPMPADFFRTMEDASGTDLDWFWRGWFYSTDVTDIAIDTVKYAKADPDVTIPQPGTVKRNLPKPLVNDFEDISKIRNRTDPNAPAGVVSTLTDFSGAATAVSRAAGQVELRRSTTNDAWHRRDDVPSYYGGGGITLSWGSSKLAADLGLPGHAGPVAVLGAGIMGLSTARLVQDAEVVGEQVAQQLGDLEERVLRLRHCGAECGGCEQRRGGKLARGPQRRTQESV